MRFLIITKSRIPLPPDMAPALFDAMLTWIDGNMKSGKMEQSWGFAGVAAGGGILNVESLEELDGIMTNMPFGPFSKTKVYGLIDATQALNAGKNAMARMMGKA